MLDNDALVAAAATAIEYFGAIYELHEYISGESPGVNRLRLDMHHAQDGLVVRIELGKAVP